MKTKDAFAFRDFDKNKILQRQLFKNLKVDGAEFLKDNSGGDGAIFDSLAATDDVNTNDLNLRKLQAILDGLIYLQEKHIDKRHLLRLTRFKRATKNQNLKERAGDLQSKYDKIAAIVSMVQADVRDRIEPLEKTVQQQSKEIFAQRLKQVRQEQKISQQDLSNMTKINRADIGLYETAKKYPAMENFLKIARCTKVSADYLLGLERV